MVHCKYLLSWLLWENTDLLLARYVGNDCLQYRHGYLVCGFVLEESQVLTERDYCL